MKPRATVRTQACMSRMIICACYYLCAAEGGECQRERAAEGGECQRERERERERERDMRYDKRDLTAELFDIVHEVTVTAPPAILRPPP